MPGHLARSALRPTLITRQSLQRQITTRISTFEKVGKSGFTSNIFWMFFSIPRVFKSRNDSSMWSLWSEKRNNLDSKERFRKKSLDVKKKKKQSQLLLTGRLPWASTNPHNLRPREVKRLVQDHTANMRLQPHTAEAPRVDLWPQVGGWTWTQASRAWLSAPPSNKLSFLTAPFPLNRVFI